MVPRENKNSAYSKFKLGAGMGGGGGEGGDKQRVLWYFPK